MSSERTKDYLNGILETANANEQHISSTVRGSFPPFHATFLPDTNTHCLGFLCPRKPSNQSPEDEQLCASVSGAACLWICIHVCFVVCCFDQFLILVFHQNGFSLAAYS